MSNKKNTSVLLYGGLVRGWTQATGLAVFGLGARILGVADFGVFAMAVAFITIVQIFLYSGVYEYTLRCNREDGLDATLLVMNIAVSLAGALVSAAMGWVIALASHQPAVAWLTLSMAPSALIAGVTAWHEAHVLRNNRYDIYYKVWLVAETLAAIAGGAYLLFGAELYSLVAYRYLQSSLMLMGYVFLFPVPYLGALKLKSVREIWRFAAPIYGSRLMNALSSYGVDLIAGILISPAAAGLYRMSSRLVSSLSEVLFQPLRVVAWIRASRVKTHSAARVVLALLPLNHLAALLLWPAAVVLAFIAGDALTIGLGPSWRAASIIITSLLVARGIGLSEVFLEPLLASIGSGRLLLILRSASIVAMISCLILVAPLGAAYTGLPSIAGALVPGVGVSIVIIRATGFRRLAASVADGALTAGLIAAVFLAGVAGIHFAGWNPLLIHAAGAVCGGLILGGMLLRQRSQLKLLKKSPQAVQASA